MEIIKNIVNWYNSLDKINNSLLLLVCTIILFFVLIYLIIIYYFINKKITDLNDYVLKVPKLGKLYNIDSYDPDIFEKLLMDALTELRKNVNTITVPYFYSKTIDEILQEFPTFTTVLKFSQYVDSHSDTRSDAVHKVLVKNYGSKYVNSPELTFEVTNKISEFKTSTYKHSILIDLSKAQYIYKKNKTKIDSILNIK